PLLNEERIDLAHRTRALDDKLMEEGLAHIDSIPWYGVDLFSGVVSFVIAQFSDAAQTVFAHKGKIDAGGQGHQTLIGANVAAGFLAADVLLARAEGHHVGAAAILIDSFADDAPSNFADVFGTTAEEAEIRAAETHWNAEGLSLADHNVRTEF